MPPRITSGGWSDDDESGGRMSSARLPAMYLMSSLGDDADASLPDEER